MQCYTVSFFGHREFEHVMEVSQALEKLVHRLLSERSYVEFLVGRNGDFDQLVSSTVRQQKRVYRDDNSALIWVMPYMTADFRENEASYRAYYDEIELHEGTHYKSAIQQRNRDMVERSDLVVVCVGRKSGGAYQTLRYAQRQGKEIVNLYPGAKV